jgi:tetratricopeptide (TPR) repeat protein
MTDSTGLGLMNHSDKTDRGQALAEQGEKLFHESRYDEALPFLQEAIQLGNPLAQYTLGIMYQFGYGVPENQAEARRYYDLAVAQNYAPAIHNLIYMYLYGSGGPRDPERAFNLANLAIQLGDLTTGLNTLALMHIHGIHVQHDLTKAQELLEQSTKSPSNNLGFIDLAYIYETGSNGVTKDQTKALQLLVDGYRFATVQNFRDHYKRQFAEFMERVTASPFSGRSDQILQYLADQKRILETQQHDIHDLQRKIHDLQRRNHDLQTQIDYSPGNVGYQLAQEHFKTLAHPDQNHGQSMT